MPRPRKPPSPFRYFNSSPEVIRLVVIRLVVMMYVRFPLSLRNVEDLLFERGIDLCHETAQAHEINANDYESASKTCTKDHLSIPFARK